MCLQFFSLPLITLCLPLPVVVMAPKLNTSSPNNSTILVTWTPVEHAVLYTLCIIREGSSSRLKLNTTDTMVTFDDLEAGTTYCIKGTAWDSEGRAGDDLTVCQITCKSDEHMDRNLQLSRIKHNPIRKVGGNMNAADHLTHFLLVSPPGPPSPDVTDVQMTQGRSFEVAVFWRPVQGADSYMAWTSNGQNCTSSAHHYCLIAPVDCGQNHSVSVTAFNRAGSSFPSQPADYITCGYITYEPYSFKGRV